MKEKTCSNSLNAISMTGPKDLSDLSDLSAARYMEARISAR